MKKSTPQPREIARRIVVDPEVRFGQPVIKGTRVPVSVLLEELAAGSEVVEITREYGVTREDVRAAIRFAAQLVATRGTGHSARGMGSRAYCLARRKTGLPFTLTEPGNLTAEPAETAEYCWPTSRRSSSREPIF
jgi:uncharacterized protein (DUF433 family)